MTYKIQRTLAEYFPEVDLPEQPLQDWAIVQLKRSFSEERTRGGIILTEVKTSDEKNQEEWHETMAMIVAVGPVFQRNREDLSYWPECKADASLILKVGDVVRIPEHLSGKFTVRTKTGDDIKCISIRDIQILRKVTDPLDAVERVKAYIPLVERKI